MEQKYKDLAVKMQVSSFFVKLKVSLYSQNFTAFILAIFSWIFAVSNSFYCYCYKFMTSHIILKFKPFG